MTRHEPVLLNQVLEYLNVKPGKFVIDGTMDGGGHAAAIIERLGDDGKFLGVDLDEGMINAARKKFPAKNVKLAHANYAEIPDILRDHNLGKADGLLLDLGFSSEQLESSGRGFSFTKDEPLLMTYSDDEAPAYQVIARLREEELTQIIREYSEERYAGRIAQAIVAAGKIKPIRTSGELAAIVADALPRQYERGRIHPATRTFQALRIYVNHEIQNLRKILSELQNILAPDGRAVVISFHSLEDREVKNTFRELAKQNKVEILTKKPITVSEEEMQTNPRARSAKLRAIQIRP